MVLVLSMLGYGMQLAQIQVKVWKPLTTTNMFKFQKLHCDTQFSP